MAERKVINKYYSPDFDPEKIPRRRQLKNQQIKVRMMLPMSIRCSTCGNYIYKGTKFNSRKEDVVGETYLGIQVFRFYFKCSKCSSEITLKTDPQNSDYVVEFGASRNFEPWRAEDEQLDEKNKKRKAEEMGNAMKSLENKTLNSKREMVIVAALDEIKSLKLRQATISVDTVLQTLKRMDEQKAKKMEEEDEAKITALYYGLKEQHVRRRIQDEDADIAIKKPKKNGGRRIQDEDTDIARFSLKSSSVTISISRGKKLAETTIVPNGSLQSLLQQYGSDVDDD